MSDRRQILAALKAVSAATPIKVDDASALLVIDAQNCFLPGGEGR
jgi:nicotinamidase/pyrazinamidase